MAEYTHKTDRFKIRFKEVALPTGPQVHCTPEGTTVTRVFHLLDGSLWRSFMIDLLGTSHLNVAETKILRYPPYQDLEFKRSDGEGGQGLYAQECRLMEPTGQSSTHRTGKFNVYGSLKFEVTFRPLDWNPGEKGEVGAGVSEITRYTRRDPQFKVEAVPYPAQANFFRYKDSGGATVPEPGNKRVVGGNLKYEWLQIPASYDETLKAWRLPSGIRTNIANAVGTINSTTFDTIYPAKSLYCAAPEIVWTFQADNRPTAKIIYNFDQRGIKDPGTVGDDETHSVHPLWDRALRLDATTGKPHFWQIETNDDTPQGPFETTDFATLWNLS